MLGPANSFKSYEWIGTGSGAAAAVTDSVVQNGTYRVNGSDVFGTSITVHVSGGTSGGAPLVVPAGGVDLTYNLTGNVLTWLTGGTPFYVYQKP